VVAQFSLPQRRKNQTVVFIFIFMFCIKFKSSLLKEKNLLRKKRIGLGIRISLLPRSKKKKTMFEPRF
jgi:hypothetical protein